MSPRCFVGFGFEPVQAALFLHEAFRSHKFDRLILAEANPSTVASLRGGGGAYTVNVATDARVEAREISGLEVFDPEATEDREALLEAIASAHAIATALPSAAAYDEGVYSPARLLARGLERRRSARTRHGCVIYTGEQGMSAAQTLTRLVAARLESPGPSPAESLASLGVQVVNTITSQISGMVFVTESTPERTLAPMTPGTKRALLCEAYNRIYIDPITLPEYEPAIEVFEQRPDLVPFEQARLFAQKTIQTLLGHLAQQRGYHYMDEARGDEPLIEFIRAALLEEVRPALLSRHRGIDPIFTPEGFAAFGEELIGRLTNRWLHEKINRIVRAPEPKLGWNERMIGAMRLAIAAKARPQRIAQGVALMLAELQVRQPYEKMALLDKLWVGVERSDPMRVKVEKLILDAIRDPKLPPR